jgi:hypothetical protein
VNYRGGLPATTLLLILTRLDALSATSAVADIVASQLATAIEHDLVAVDSVIAWLDSAGLSSDKQDDRPSHGRHNAWQTVVVATARTAAESANPLDNARAAILSQALYAWHKGTHTFLSDRHRERQILTDEGRRRLIALMLPDLPDRAATYHLRQAGWVATADLTWLVRRWGPDAADVDTSYRTKMLVSMLVDPTNLEQEELARSVAVDFLALIPAIDELFDPHRAAEITAERAAATERAARHAARASTDQFRLDTLTDAVHAGDWRAVVRSMNSPVGTRQHAIGALPTDAPTWRQLDSVTNTHVVDCALTYLQATPATFDASRPGDVGFAYTLVHTERLDAIGTLDPDAVLAWPDVLRQQAAQHHTVESMLADLVFTCPEQLEQIVVQSIAEDAARPTPADPHARLLHEPSRRRRPVRPRHLPGYDRPGSPSGDRGVERPEPFTRCPRCPPRHPRSTRQAPDRNSVQPRMAPGSSRPGCAGRLPRCGQPTRPHPEPARAPAKVR